MNINDFLSLEGLNFILVRNEQKSSILGLFEPDSDPNGRYVSFDPNSDVRAGDVLIHPNGKHYSVIDTEIEYFSQVPYALKAYYEKESSASQSYAQTFNIGTVHGSFIGTTSHSSISYTATFSELRDSIKNSDSQDKEQLHELVDYLEFITSNKQPLKQGCLSKFAAVLQRNTWFTTPLSTSIFSWLTAQL